MPPARPVEYRSATSGCGAGLRPGSTARGSHPCPSRRAAAARPRDGVALDPRQRGGAAAADERLGSPLKEPRSPIRIMLGPSESRSGATSGGSPWRIGSTPSLKAPGGFEPPVEVLQTSALPLGDGADLVGRSATLKGPPRACSAPVDDLRWRPTVAHADVGARERRLERETGFEPATSTLARSHSTTELLPLRG